MEVMWEDELKWIQTLIQSICIRRKGLRLRFPHKYFMLQILLIISMYVHVL
jgi:hypothetical protein